MFYRILNKLTGGVLQKMTNFINASLQLNKKIINQNSQIIKCEKLLLDQNKEILKQNRELEWAHIYHDSIRDKPWLTNLSINVGRWAGNYSFFYILNRILNDCSPESIIEFGLGESSKIISSYLENKLTNTRHDIIEQSEEWAQHFTSRFKISNNSSIHIHQLIINSINGFNTNGYADIQRIASKKYDLYVVDGPLGSENYSRYDIVTIAKGLSKNDEFIILFDDYNRPGEKETYNDLVKILESKNITFHNRIYYGTKSTMVIGTKKYKFVRTL